MKEWASEDRDRHRRGIVVIYSSNPFSTQHYTKIAKKVVVLFTFGVSQSVWLFGPLKKPILCRLSKCSTFLLECGGVNFLEI